MPWGQVIWAQDDTQDEKVVGLGACRGCIPKPKAN